jgi:HK97 family phage portal protein
VILDTPSGRIVDVARPSSVYNAWSLPAEWSLAKQAVSTDTALALVAVYGAVSLVADTNGVMPLEVIDTKAQSGKRVVQGGWMPTLLQHAPNADMTGIDVWVYVNACLMLRGNAYLAKLREDGTGRVTALYPVNPAQVYPYRGQDGRKLFRVSIQTGETYVDSVFTEDAILHIKGRSLTDPLVGASPIEHARHALGTQLAQQEYQARNYADGMLIKGVLTTPQANITPDAAARIKQQWRSAYQGTGNSHDVAVLHSGVTFQSVAMSPEDAQFIQTMRWGHTQIATMYKIPASRMNGESASLTYANQGQDDLFYDKQACLPLRRMIEAALNRDTDLFGPASAWVPKFNAEVMLQADIDTRFKVYRTAREIGVMSQNDILRAEDRPTIGAEGDDYTPLGASTTGVRGAAVDG